MNKQYTVRGHWPFPLDMLRHDGSQAASFVDQEKIDRLSDDYAPDREAFQDVEINLIGPNKQNTARWESFGWSVPDDREHAFYKVVREEADGEQRLLDSALAKLSEEERSAVRKRMASFS